ncbi:MAG: type IV pilin protein [Thermodesulfobacteriota bacterium]
MRNSKIIHLMRGRKGLTLIELLIVIIIVGILAAIAIPSYTNYMVRARRADAKTALEQLRAAQEMRRAERGSYETNLAALRTTWGGPDATVGDYTIQWADGFVLNANSFTAEASPFNPRQIADGPLRINHLGAKTPPDKWAK